MQGEPGLYPLFIFPDLDDLLSTTFGVGSLFGNITVGVALFMKVNHLNFVCSRSSSSLPSVRVTGRGGYGVAIAFHRIACCFLMGDQRTNDRRVPQLDSATVQKDFGKCSLIVSTFT